MKKITWTIDNKQLIASYETIDGVKGREVFDFIKKDQNGLLSFKSVTSPKRRMSHIKYDEINKMWYATRNNTAIPDIFIKCDLNIFV